MSRSADPRDIQKGDIIRIHSLSGCVTDVKVAQVDRDKDGLSFRIWPVALAN